MLDQEKATEAFSQDEALIAAGAQVRIEDFAGLLHHKFAILDVAGSDPTVILGSCNMPLRRLGCRAVFDALARVAVRFCLDFPPRNHLDDWIDSSCRHNDISVKRTPVRCCAFDSNR